MRGFGRRAEACRDHQFRTRYGAVLPSWYSQVRSRLFHLIPTARVCEAAVEEVASILVANGEFTLKTVLRGGVLVSSTSSAVPGGRTDRKPFHILATKFLDGNEVLVNFSDGTAAVFEAEELEKLRPVPKRMLPCSPNVHEPTVMDSPIAPVPSGEKERPLILGGAVA